MKTKLAVVAIVLALAYLVVAQSEPTSQSMLTALMGIQDAIVEAVEQPEREWYHGNFEIAPSQNDALLVVPIGQQFVLKKLYVCPYKGNLRWHLAANDTVILPGSIIISTYAQGSYVYKHEHDFPDDCIIIRSEETLNAVNESDFSLDVIIIGYYQAIP